MKEIIGFECEEVLNLKKNEFRNIILILLSCMRRKSTNVKLLTEKNNDTRKRRRTKMSDDKIISVCVSIKWFSIYRARLKIYEELHYYKWLS